MAGLLNHSYGDYAVAAALPPSYAPRYTPHLIPHRTASPSGGGPTAAMDFSADADNEDGRSMALPTHVSMHH